MTTLFVSYLIVFAEDYNSARKKIKRAEATSSLETDVDDVAASRERRKRTFSDHEQEDMTCDKDVIPKKAVKAKRTLCTTESPQPPAALVESTFIAMSSNEGSSRSFSNHEDDVEDSCDDSNVAVPKKSVKDKRPLSTSKAPKPTAALLESTFIAHSSNEGILQCL